MDDERDEILNAIQNDFFNEGIYRISEGSVKIPIEIINAEPEKDEVFERITPPLEIISVVEEPEKELTLLTKEGTNINLPEQEETTDFFGGNKKGVAILVNYRDERWIYFKDKIILEKILESVKLKFDDVALINTHIFRPGSIEELSDKLKISKIIGFGINDPFVKGLNREEPVKTAKSAVFLMNSDLNEIAMDHAKKRILWNNLKLMFNIG